MAAPTFCPVGVFEVCAMKQRIIYALGFFDGVHLGHQALLAATVKLAAQVEAIPGVVTFSAHPDRLVSGQAPGLLTTGEVRNELLRIYGMKQVLELPFDRQVMNTHWASFLSQLADAGAAGFVCGDDFRFGSGGLGTPKKLEAFCKRRGIAYAIVSQRTQAGTRVSSTHIRSLLEQGEMEQVNLFLGHPHFLSGVVVEGRKLGRTIGIPTANVEIPAQLAVLNECLTSARAREAARKARELVKRKTGLYPRDALDLICGEIRG